MKKIILIFLFNIYAIAVAEQKIFVSTKLKGNDLRKEILKWVKMKQEIINSAAMIMD